MGEKYEGETCEGCVHWLQDACTLDDPLDISDGHPACEKFHPGLELRQVLALERLADNTANIMESLFLAERQGWG